MSKKRWQPDKDQCAVLKTIFAMTVDALGGNGVDSKETFAANLRLFANVLVPMEEKDATSKS